MPKVLTVKVCSVRLLMISLCLPTRIPAILQGISGLTIRNHVLPTVTLFMSRMSTTEQFLMPLFLQRVPLGNGKNHSVGLLPQLSKAACGDQVLLLKMPCAVISLQQVRQQEATPGRISMMLLPPTQPVNR